MMIRRVYFWVLVVVLFAFSNPSWAKMEIDWGAFVENDLRINVDRVDEPGIGRNQTTLGADLRTFLIPNKLNFVGELRFVWTGFTKDTTFEGLTTRSTVSPYYLESQAVYLEVVSLLPYLDLRVGRQVVHWGSADMFNPTNNLNALDLEDPLLFGETIANQMIRLDFYPGDMFIFTAVWVPVFQPAMLPASGMLAIGDPTSEFPYVDPATRVEAEKLRDIWLRDEDNYILDQPVLHAEMPEFSLANSQFGLRVQWTAGLFDMSLSYYQGRDSIPVPVSSISDTRLTDEISPSGNAKIGVETDVKVIYPKKKVVGFDFSGQIPFLDDAGIWFEGAFVFPEAAGMVFDVTKVVTSARIITGESVTDTPFFKCTTGMDYSINEYLFVTGQFIHGFVDEFGSHKINDYWIVASDVNLLNQRLMLRFAVIGEFPHEDDDITLNVDGDQFVDSFADGATNDGTISSYVIFPQVTVKPLDALELILGGYFLLGHAESKFAMPAAGPSLVFFRAKASF